MKYTVQEQAIILHTLQGLTGLEVELVTEGTSWTRARSPKPESGLRDIMTP
ncbi:hypothetical protein DPMN_101115 [Dreissena polymorpha]|uniref:Uncharacterized protein n=1 Tax=Dreissena polymorpha TaxID=45954 RepID=A0A9D4LI56_DREPO|nr:hypothetical protein DPMN_101115 [Dreissena polymorpha]